MKPFFTKTALLLGLALPLLAPPTATRAELPPSAYQDMQQKATEVVTIRVQNVYRKTTKETWGERTRVTVIARVTKVARSKAGLKTGQTIQIRYAHDTYNEPIAGPSQIPILKTGQTCPAYLKPIKGKTFAPAAGGYSFEKMGVG